ncbi:MULTISPECIES: alpha/beta hydrolase [Microbulbifer]|uniref:alpha/beta hydrolase n=1 Tax=Microbulbifer TaxID=48073 RepID=UPI001E5F1AB5|nr:MULTISPECIES: alpha/beta hydrolase-fold protein [Microbulbifer]UHQ56854.1 alpha/beta hydrolase [Microbulbifer sp. YPW16]
MPPIRAFSRLATLLAGVAAATLAALPAAATGESDMPAHTVAGNVQILSPVTMDSLGRQRTIRLYLPPGYSDGDRRYPVLYMHDGQNLFDNATAYAREWGVDETLNRLAAETGLELIVVGIDHGNERRIHELVPFDHPEYGPAEGQAYLEFIVNQLKPLVDARFRTLPDRLHTAIMGSSLGGLMSHYALLQHPETFSRAGVFSPAYWIAPQFHALARDTARGDDTRLYLLVGGAEGDEMVQGYRDMERLLGQQRPAGSWRARLVEGAGHNEAFWREEFARAVRWLFAARES